MFSLAILIGIYSYLILGIGLLGLLYRQAILLLTLIYILVLIYFFKNKIIESYHKLKLLPFNIKKYKLESFLILLLIIQAVVNLVGALGQELGFDALWYHLTLPKLYIQNHAVIHIPGSLLYYSDMPKLTEMLYTASLLFGNEVLAKLIHFSFGLLSSIALYFLSRKFFNARLSVLAVLIFYSNLVVGWESITAYIDLARTFFEVMSLWGFVNFLEDKRRKWLIESAVMVGLAVSTKLLALGSIAIFLCLIVYISLSRRDKIKKVLENLLIFIFFSLLIPLPWFVFSFVHTGNPFYPLLTGIYPISFNLGLLNPSNFLIEIWNLLIRSADPISPLYLIFLPLILIVFKKFSKTLKFIGLYCLFAFTVWYFTPRTGGGRFILPYLPAFSILIIAVIEKLSPPRRNPFGHLRGVTTRLLGGDLRLVLISFAIIVSIIPILYRGVANAKFVPVILGKESKSHFLSDHLNFSFGDFYDTDRYFAKNITSRDTVLLYGFHNLYYVNFPSIDSSWVKKSDRFNYVATQNSNLPKRFSDWDLVYYNPKTNVNLYTLGGIKWAY